MHIWLVDKRLRSCNIQAPKQRKEVGYGTKEVSERRRRVRGEGDEVWGGEKKINNFWLPI